MNDITTLLGISDTGRLAEFLLDKMSMDTRHALMAELPAVYAKLYPNVSPELLANHVAARIRRLITEVTDSPVELTRLADERKRSLMTDDEHYQRYGSLPATD